MIFQSLINTICRVIKANQSIYLHFPSINNLLWNVLLIHDTMAPSSVLFKKCMLLKEVFCIMRKINGKDMES